MTGDHTTNVGLDMERLPRFRPSTLAIGALAVGTALYEYYCPDKELISERCDEWMEHPVKRLVLQAGVGALALHLINVTPQKYDIFHYLSKFKHIDKNT